MSAIVEFLSMARSDGFRFSAWAARAVDEVVEWYRVVLDCVFRGWLPPLVEVLARLVPWRVHLPDDLPGILTLLTIYLWAHVAEARQSQVPNRLRASMQRLFAALTSLFVAIVVATAVSAYADSRLLTSATSSTVGIAIYRILFALQFASDIARRDRTPTAFREAFLDKARGAAVIVLGGGAIALVATVVSLSGIGLMDFLWILILAATLGWFHFSLAKARPHTVGNRRIATRIWQAVVFTLLSLLLGSESLRRLL